MAAVAAKTAESARAVMARGCLWLHFGAQLPNWRDARRARPARTLQELCSEADKIAQRRGVERGPPHFLTVFRPLCEHVLSRVSVCESVHVGQTRGFLIGDGYGAGQLGGGGGDWGRGRERADSG